MQTPAEKRADALLDEFYLKVSKVFSATLDGAFECETRDVYELMRVEMEPFFRIMLNQSRKMLDQMRQNTCGCDETKRKAENAEKHPAVCNILNECDKTSFKERQQLWTMAGDFIADAVEAEEAEEKREETDEEMPDLVEIDEASDSSDEK